jgi:hypothetical protein
MKRCVGVDQPGSSVQGAGTEIPSPVPIEASRAFPLGHTGVATCMTGASSAEPKVHLKDLFSHESFSDLPQNPTSLAA